MRHLVAVALALAALPPAVASADNTILAGGGQTRYFSEDAAVSNAFSLEDRGDEVRFFEPNDVKGHNFPPSCRPGEVRAGVVIEVFCPRSVVGSRITVEAGPGENVVRYAVAGITGALVGDNGADRIESVVASDDVLVGLRGNDRLDAGPGKDELDGEAGNDTLNGGEGDDELDGGAGTDSYDAGAGDDTVRAADGNSEVVACGAGSDTVFADPGDEVRDCETVQRQSVEAVAEEADDGKRPVLKLGGLTEQRVKRSKPVVEVLLVSNEAGEVAVSGYVDADGLNTAIKPVRRAIEVGGGGVRVRLVLSRRAAAFVRRDLRRGRKPVVHVSATAVDGAGSTSRPRSLRIRLRS